MARDTRVDAAAGLAPREAVLITEARSSVEEQHRKRVRKYLAIMSFRIPALVLAAVSYGIWANPWIAMAIVGVSIPLPWMAVLIANDRPPRTADEPSRYGYTARDSSAIEARPHPIVDTEPDVVAADDSDGPGSADTPGPTTPGPTTR